MTPYLQIAWNGQILMLHQEEAQNIFDAILNNNQQEAQALIEGLQVMPPQ